MSLKSNLSFLVGGAIIGASVMFYLRPTPQNETKIVEVVKEVSKEIIVSNQLTTVSKDGTSTTSTSTTTTKNIVKDESKAFTITERKNDWLVSAGYDTRQIYYGSVQRRLLDNILIGVGYRSSGEVQALVSIEF